MPEIAAMRRASDSRRLNVREATMKTATAPMKAMTRQNCSALGVSRRATPRGLMTTR